MVLHFLAGEFFQNGFGDNGLMVKCLWQTFTSLMVDIFERLRNYILHYIIASVCIFIPESKALLKFIILRKMVIHVYGKSISL